jgi:hypothetical protein
MGRKIRGHIGSGPAKARDRREAVPMSMPKTPVKSVPSQVGNLAGAIPSKKRGA